MGKIEYIIVSFKRVQTQLNLILTDFAGWTALLKAKSVFLFNKGN